MSYLEQKIYQLSQPLPKEYIIMVNDKETTLQLRDLFKGGLSIGHKEIKGYSYMSLMDISKIKFKDKNSDNIIEINRIYNPLIQGSDIKISEQNIADFKDLIEASIIEEESVNININTISTGQDLFNEEFDTYFKNEGYEQFKDKNHVFLFRDIASPIYLIYIGPNDFKEIEPQTTEFNDNLMTLTENNDLFIFDVVAKNFTVTQIVNNFSA